MSMTGLAAPTATDDALLAGLRNGDADAYESTVRAYGERMLAACRRLLGNEEDARDAVQEAFLAAFKAIGKFEGKSRLGTWLHRIAINAALMKLRSRQSRPYQSIESLLPRFIADGYHADPVDDWSERADTALERDETREFVRKAIQSLPEIYRTVLMLRDIEELDTQEAAKILKIDANAVKVRLHRARQALRTLLNEHFSGETQ